VAAVTRTENRPRARRVSVAAAFFAAAFAALLMAGCGGGSGSSGGDSAQARERQALASYVSQIEPLRLAVNKLLDGADPILGGYREHRLTSAQAQRRLGELERRFAVHMREVAAVKPVPPNMVAAQRAYAHTYRQEDAYLRALIAALPRRDWRALPNFEPSQRRALVAWRAKLALQAARLHVALPTDVEIAGRDEIAPSPLGD
jgi:hypothetical protein